MNFKDLENLKYLRYLKDNKFIIVVVVIAATTYLLVKSPKIKYSTEIQLEKAVDFREDSSNNNSSINLDTLKK